MAKAKLTVAERINKIEQLELRVNRATALAMLARQSNDGFETYDGRRDLEKILGWNSTVDYPTYNKMYRRGGIAKTVVNLPATSTWKGDITVSGPKNEDGESTEEGKRFEEEWNALWKNKNIRDAMLRADKLAGIGQYSVIRIGFSNDSESDISEPLKGGKHDLLYLSVFSQPNAQPKKFNDDPSSENYGGIDVYNLRLVSDRAIALGASNPNPTSEAGEAYPVNADRCVHIAEQLMEDNIFGTPRLEAPWNLLTDLQKTTGGSAEMYWRGAFPGYNFNLDPEADVSDERLEAMGEQIENMILGLGRYTQTEGVNVDSVTPQVVSPDPQISAHLDQISGTTRIPKRKLIGSERGELASGQDEANWNSEVECRRENDCNRWLRDLIDKLMGAGALSRVSDYTVEWPSLEAEKGLENSQIAVNISKAIAGWASAGGEDTFPLSVFLEEVLNFDKDKAQEIAGLSGEGEDDDLVDGDDEAGSLIQQDVGRIIAEAVSRLSATPPEPKNEPAKKQDA